MPELIKNLLGHSGCNLNLYKEEDRIFLRKDAGNANYNRRLKKQFIKQKKFNLEKVKTPRIFEYGINNKGIFYFDMEYINGITLSEYMKQIKIKEIVDLITLLFESLPIKQGGYFDRAQNIFQHKISDLETILDTSDINIKQSLDLLKKYDFSKVPQSSCCGDLTLENIIINMRGEIYVIDLLDSFYNSWMIDVAKLLQDVELGWSYRKQVRDFGLNLRLATAKQALFDNILSLEEGQTYLVTIYHILLLNILRIYPYAKDKLTLDFLDNSILQIFENIKNLKGK